MQRLYVSMDKVYDTKLILQLHHSLNFASDAEWNDCKNHRDLQA